MGDVEVMRVNVDAYKVGDSCCFSAKGATPDADEGVKSDFGILDAMDPNAAFGETRRKASGVRALLVPADNRFVGKKPVVASAPLILAICVAPPRDVGFVLVGNPDAFGTSVKWNHARLGEMEEILVAVVDVAF